MLGEIGQKYEERLREIKKLRSKSTLEEMRENQKKRASKLPEDAEKTLLNIKGVETEKITFPNSRSSSALVYIHGGGFKNGYASNGYWLCTQIARNLGMTIYGINYSLAPEDTYPAAFMDCVKVWRKLLEWGVDPGESSIIGTSAGGTIALSLSLWCRDHGIYLPSSLILSSPYIGEGIEPTHYQIDNDAILDYRTASEKEILKNHSDKLDEILNRDGILHSYFIDKDLWHAFLNSNVPENEKYVAKVIEIIKENYQVKGASL